MKNGWTGGQYTIYRILFGLYLMVHFFQLIPWSVELFSNQGVIGGSQSPFMMLFPNILMLSDSPWFVYALTTIGVVAACSFTLGKKDRLAALLLWYLLTCFLNYNPLISNPSLPFIGWLLLIHVFLPTYRMDFRRKWKIPPALFFAAWLVMSVGYTYSGILKLNSPSWVDGSALLYVLQNPLARLNALRSLLLCLPPIILKTMTWCALTLEVGFVFMALFRKVRPWLWLAMLSMHLGILCVVNFADLTFGMIIVHLFTFDPAWIGPKRLGQNLNIYYDGTCGFCNYFVRFVLSENQAKQPYRFFPLEEEMPKSIIVMYNKHRIEKSEAVFFILASLGGFWRAIAFIGSLLPKSVCDLAYSGVAKVRHRLFTKSSNCPILPPELKKYFPK